MPPCATSIYCLCGDLYGSFLLGVHGGLPLGPGCLPRSNKQTRKVIGRDLIKTHFCALQARMYTEQLDTFYLKSWTLHLKTFANKSLLGELEFKFWSVSNPSNLR